MGLFSGEPLFSKGRIDYWREFYISNWVGRDNKNRLIL